MTYHANSLGADYSAAIAEGAKATSTIADIAAGGPQKRERESRRNLEIAQLTAQGAAAGSANALAIARLQAEAARDAAASGHKSSNKNTMLIVGGVVGVAVLGLVGMVLMPKRAAT